MNGKTGISNKSVTNVNEAYLSLVGAILNGVAINPHYSMCSCAKNWADIGGIDINIIYEKARRGTRWESIPLQVLDHSDWAKKDRKLRRTKVRQ